MFFVTCASAVAAAAVLGLNLFEGGPVRDCGEGCSEGFSVDVPRVVVAVAPQLELCTAKMSDKCAAFTVAQSPRAGGWRQNVTKVCYVIL